MNNQLKEATPEMNRGMTFENDSSTDEEEIQTPADKPAEQAQTNTDEQPFLPTPDATPKREFARPTTQNIIADVTEANIVEGPRTRRKTEKARKQAYVTRLAQLEEPPGYHAAGLQPGTPTPGRGSK